MIGFIYLSTRVEHLSRGLVTEATHARIANLFFSESTMWSSIGDSGIGWGFFVPAHTPAKMFTGSSPPTGTVALLVVKVVKDCGVYNNKEDVALRYLQWCPSKRIIKSQLTTNILPPILRCWRLAHDLKRNERFDPESIIAHIVWCFWLKLKRHSQRICMYGAPNVKILFTLFEIYESQS